MKVSVHAFGIVRDIFGNSVISRELPESANVGDLRVLLEEEYPRLKQLSSYMVAQNDEYADISDAVGVHNEIAIIPPVSGG